MEKKIIAVLILLCCFTTIGIFLSKEQATQSKDAAVKDLLEDFSSSMLSNGENMYQFYCDRCHSERSENRIVGKGLWERLPEKNGSKFLWLQTYLEDTEAMVKSGDKAAQALKNEYNNSVSHHIKLSEEELLALLVFIENEK